MVATAALEELHTAVKVTSWELLSLNFPVAANCFVAPMGMLEFAGVTAMDTSVAAETVTDAVPLMPPELAVSVMLPAAIAVATPELLTASEFGADEDHVSEVSNCVLPSSNAPVALNDCSVPMAMVAVAGLTVIDCRCAATTVSVEESLKPPALAEIVVVPSLRVVASPVLSTLATAELEELHVTPPLRSALDPSLYIAVATYFWLTPMGIVRSPGETEIEVIVGALTVMANDCVTVPNVAVIVAEPAATAVSTPLTSTLATTPDEEFQATTVVMSLLLPSL